jgi:hypothetical protein
VEVHEIELENRGGLYRLRIGQEKGDGTAVVYFPIKGEKFTLAVYLDTMPVVVVRAVDTLPYTSVYFKAISEIFDFQKLSTLTVLQNSGGWSKGDKRRIGTAIHQNSCIRFEPNPEPDDFEDKLLKLIVFLEQDIEGVKTLINEAGGYIQVAMEFHNGNTLLGGPHIELNLIKRMSLLDLHIDFDLYVAGNSFIS